ncbi:TRANSCRIPTION FACTOR BHLH83-RELATED [Salix purpurea]|uniref:TRANSCRIPTION FACTOR BHLH83-RELATED n=1 Tax=Salix purpurea TaxID=77065 RepID=A0A9Q0WH55_SALPP|nr:TRANSCRIPTION FACTOR BHLH83-RELATED [Salix purpurea]
MSLANDRMGSVQTCACNGNVMGDFSSLGSYGFCEYQKVEFHEEGDRTFQKTSGLMIRNLGMNSSPNSLGSPSSAISGELVFQATDHQAEEAHSLINFKGIGLDNVMHSNGSLISFEQSDRVSQTSCQKDDYTAWEGNLSYNYQWNQMNRKCNKSPRLMEDFNCFQRASNFNSMTEKENHGDWLYAESTIVADSFQDSATPDASNFHKRPNMGESMQALKKQCNDAIKNPKPKSAAGPAKDLQSVAAKNRRERISERLKILQDLVPNGSKVDLVTMLEKAISYVKFLQLQVKVLATDDFWPVQGGKAPDFSQVKEAIDALLSPQTKDRNSGSSSK